MADSRNLQILLTLKDQATKELNNFSSKLKKNAEGFRTMAVTGGIAFGALTVGVTKAVGEASDLEESINAVNVVFGEGSEKILEFGKTANKQVGMTNSAFNQMSTQTGALLGDVGLSQDEVAERTIELTKRASDMASVFNTDVGDAMSAINQALRGETEAIRRYAGDVTDATLETFALSQGITKSVTEMTQQEKRLLRVDLIMKQTAVTEGDFANTSDSLANKQRILSATITDISATLGNTFIPIIQNVLNAVAPVIEKVSVWIKENPELAKNILIAVGAITGLVTIIGTLGLLLPPLIAGFTLMTGPIGLVTVAIMALIAGGVLLVKNWENIKKYAKIIWEGIGNIMSGIMDSIKEGIKGTINWVIDKLNWLVDKANYIQKGLNKVPGVNIPLLPSIPRLAKGGIVTKPTLAMVGEDGPEAVVPLTKRNNPNLNSGGTTIINNITVNGDVSGEELVSKVEESLMDKLRLNTQLSY